MFLWIFFAMFVTFEWLISEARRFKEPRQTLVKRGLVVLFFAVFAGLLYFELRGRQFGAWASDRDFLTLVIMSVICGALSFALIWASRIPWRGRIAHFPVAATALWFASDWAVKLGPPVSDYWDDPRLGIATTALFGTGVFAVIGILVAIDWHINWRDRVEREALARTEGETRNG